jgi:heptosyltransferase II
MKKFDINKIKKILVFQTAFLGDIVLTIPLINNIKRLWPDKYIAVLTTPIGKAVLDEVENIDEIIVYDKKNKDKGIKNFLETSKVLKTKSFDWVIIPHRSLNSALLCFLAGIKHRWGFDKSEGKIFLTKKIKYMQDLHEIERNLEFLKEFSNNLNKDIFFKQNKNTEEYVTQGLKDKGFLNNKIIGVNPGSIWNTKRWPIEKYAELIKRLVDSKYKVIVFGDKSDKDVNLFIKSNFENNSEVLNLIEKTNIKQLIGFMRKLNVYVTNDSGPMHIAAALGIPLTAIFGATTKGLGFFPYTTKGIVVEKDLKCRPCGKHGGRICPRGHFKCMRDINVDEVLDSVKQLIIKN